MMCRGISTWQRIAAFVPLLLLVMTGPGQSMLRCRIDGFSRSACCCPHDTRPPAGGPALKAAGCCDRETTANEAPAAEAAQSAAEMTVVAVSLFSPVSHVVAAPPGLAADARARRAQGPPREGPRLVLLKSAFLI